MRNELISIDLLVHYTTRGAHLNEEVVIYKAICLDVAQGHMDGGTQWETNSLEKGLLVQLVNHYTIRGVNFNELVNGNKQSDDNWFINVWVW